MEWNRVNIIWSGPFKGYLNVKIELLCPRGLKRCRRERKKVTRVMRKNRRSEVGCLGMRPQVKDGLHWKSGIMVHDIWNNPWTRCWGAVFSPRQQEHEVKARLRHKYLLIDKTDVAAVAALQKVTAGPWALPRIHLRFGSFAAQTCIASSSQLLPVEIWSSGVLMVKEVAPSSEAPVNQVAFVLATE